MIITEKWLNSAVYHGKHNTVALTDNQIALLKEELPNIFPNSVNGWKKKLIGIEISEELASIFKDARLCGPIDMALYYQKFANNIVNPPCPESSNPFEMAKYCNMFDICN